MFARKMKFKNVADFKKEVNNRINSAKNRADRQHSDLKKEILPFNQLQAENYKPIVREHTLHDAHKAIQKDIKDDLTYFKTRSDALADLKNRFNFNTQKRRTK